MLYGEESAKVLAPVEPAHVVERSAVVARTLPEESMRPA